MAMSRTTEAIDVTDTPEIRRIAEEVRASREPVVLRTGEEDLALVIPVESAGDGYRRPITEEDDTASRSAFGGWRGIVDAEQLKRDIAESRGSDRPVPEL
jgi:hypothetical protein